MALSTEQLRAEYYSLAPMAERFKVSIKDELEELLQKHKLYLGVPIEHRVKGLESIIEKIERKSVSINSVTDLPDFIGLRLILLFSRDVAKTCEVISNTLTVLQKEDTQERLDESQFGYQSFHFLIQLPADWLSVPSFASVGQFKAEIQVRTVAQHMWAAASHVLQYKQESNVPPPVRRSIHRVSAILETVDLEFERVLDARASYIASINADNINEPLNVDLLKNVLDATLPAANKTESETYADVLVDLKDFGVDSTEKLQAVISKHLDDALKKDAARVEKLKGEEHISAHHESRLKAGVFFSHVGLTRVILTLEFGTKYEHYARGRRAAQVEQRELAKKQRKKSSQRKKRASKEL